METRGIGGKILLLGTLSLSSFCSITTSESATTTTCPAVHTMASRIKSVSQQSPAALMGEGGRRSKDRPAPVCFFFSFKIAFRVLSSSVFHFRLLFVCVQSSSRHPPLLKSGEMYRRQKKRDCRYFRASIEKTRVGPFVRPDQVLITRWKLMGGGAPPPASIIDMMGLLQRHRMAGNSRL